MKIVNLETAKALQELGYDGEYAEMYNEYEISNVGTKWAKTPIEIPAPRLDDAAYWIRDRYGILIYTTYAPSERRYLYHLSDMYGYHDLSGQWADWKPTTDYEEALEAAVNKAIEIIKNNL